jgi:hypothetical protein
MKRTKAQRRLNKRGYTHEMIPLRPLFGDRRFSYVVESYESWRGVRWLGEMLDMPVRRIAMVFLSNGKKPR